MIVLLDGKWTQRFAEGSRWRERAIMKKLDLTTSLLGSSRLFGGLTVYFVGGLLFLKYQRLQSGRDMVPHVEFWTSLPGLVRVSSKVQ